MNMLTHQSLPSSFDATQPNFVTVLEADSIANLVATVQESLHQIVNASRNEMTAKIKDIDSMKLCKLMIVCII